MKHASFSRVLAGGLLALAAVSAAPVAQARPDGHVFLAPPPVVLPAPPGFDRHHGSYGAPGWRSPRHAEVERERAWRHAEWERREWQRREWERREAWRHGRGHRDHGRGWN